MCFSKTTSSFSCRCVVSLEHYSNAWSYTHTLTCVVLLTVEVDYWPCIATLHPLHGLVTDLTEYELTYREYSGSHWKNPSMHIEITKRSGMTSPFEWQVYGDHVRGECLLAHRNNPVQWNLRLRTPLHCRQFFPVLNTDQVWVTTSVIRTPL